MTIKQKYSATLATLFMFSSATTAPWQWPNFQKVNTISVYCVGCVGLTHILYSEYLKPWLAARRKKQEKIRKERELRQRYQEYVTAQRHYESD